MRVIAGLYKKRTLIAPEGIEITRPTSDRVKENLFNIIAPEIEDACVLDLFAGCGALGIEALSRGAKQVTFVENHKLALAALRKNLENLKILPQVTQIIPKKVEDFLASPSLLFRNEEVTRHERSLFDIIFADPPYQMNWLSAGLQMLEDSGYCHSRCLLILEKSSKDKHHKDIEVPIKVQNWSLQDVRKYGKTQLEFWRRNYD